MFFYTMKYNNICVPISEEKKIYFQYLNVEDNRYINNIMLRLKYAVL